MRTIEMIADLKPNGEMTVQVPGEIAPGKHRVVVLVDEKVAASGRRNKGANGKSIAISTGKFWKPQSLEQVLKSQRVKPAVFKSLLGGWPKDQLDDGFEEAIERRRRAHRRSGKNSAT